MGKKKSKSGDNNIAVNRKVNHEYFIEHRYEAGLALQGWEVKSLRANRAQLTESYVVMVKGEAWLIGAHFTPLSSASTHIKPDATRSRKLLLHQSELDRLIGAIERKGYTMVALRLYWKRNLAKLEIGLAKGKKQHDKRHSEKERDWQRDKQRMLKPR